MGKTATSRRTLLGVGACTLAAVTTVPETASAEAGLSPENEMIVRKYYRGWEIKDWPAFNALLTDDFTFSSPVDARISKAAFKKGCWDTQVASIKHFDLEHVIGQGNTAFVMYLCHTTAGKTFRNVEYLQLKGEQVASVECYFGGQNTYPTQVDAKK